MDEHKHAQSRPSHRRFNVGVRDPVPEQKWTENLINKYQSEFLDRKQMTALVKDLEHLRDTVKPKTEALWTDLFEVRDAKRDFENSVFDPRRKEFDYDYGVLEPDNPVWKKYGLDGNVLMNPVARLDEEFAKKMEADRIWQNMMLIQMISKILG